jgi:hypothetical protein
MNDVPNKQEEQQRLISEAKEHVDAILEHTKWLQSNAPTLHFVFVASPGPGKVIFSPGGREYLIQLGILDIARGLVETPVVLQIEAASRPQPSGLVSPHGAPIPLTHGRQ